MSRIAGGIAVAILFVLFFAHTFSTTAGGMGGMAGMDMSGDAAKPQDGAPTTPAAASTGGQMTMPDGSVMDMGHNLFHLFGEGTAVPRTLAELFGLSWVRTNDALLNTPTIQVLQYMMLGTGAVATVYAAYRIARRAGQARTVRALVPHLFLICLLIAINAYMFTQPMSHRA